ncbi:hypothetical protein DPMN_003186 [Dreissena polymorpha]|uniref:Uncharacterized protein n=1 Tax=Dreissena polymorpha TaxID=45954 RepID=A0A9D4RUJ6_DREPO|nr:hypothetical protein DPMN_003186 [Dreissena polymorpha]
MLMPRIVKLHRYIDHDSQMTHIDFEVARSKSKVTYSRGIPITTPYCLFVRIRNAFSIRSQKEVLRVIMSNILRATRVASNEEYKSSKAKNSDICTQRPGLSKIMPKDNLEIYEYVDSN